MLKHRRSTSQMLAFVFVCLCMSMAVLLPPSLAQKKVGNQQKKETAQHPGIPIETAPFDPSAAINSKRANKGKAPQADLRVISEVVRQPYTALGFAEEATAEELEEVTPAGIARGGREAIVSRSDASPATTLSPAASILDPRWNVSNAEASPYEWSDPSQDKTDKLKEVPQMVRKVQSAGGSFKSHELFQPAAEKTAGHARLDEVLNAKAILDLNTPAIEQLRRDKDEYLTLSLPEATGRVVELELVKVDIFAPGFKVQTSEPTNEAVEESLGIHYRGVVKGDDRSLAAISVFENEVMGFYSTEAGGNYILGRLGGDNPTDEHVLYAEADLNISFNLQCDMKDNGEAYPASDLQESGASVARCVRIYLEADYDVFQNKGTVTNTTNYLTGVFNQSATLFSNDGIPISLSEIFVWTTPSPYGGLFKSGELLRKFQEQRNAFNGDLGHLVALRGGGGVAAGFNGFCSSNIDDRQCFSGIDASHPNVPTYSWTVNVFTHEMGHLMGSRHTHACVWNGNGTAIDGCGPSAFTDPPVTYEGACSGAPIPSGGTIMSYCHLPPNPGINFAFGFGPQPRNVIVNRFNGASCLVDCGGGGCSYALNPTSQDFGASGGSGSFTVTTASSNCAWAAASNVSWITTASSGAGSGTVNFSVAANSGAARTGSITVGGQTFAVTQSAGGEGGCPSTALVVGQAVGGALTTSDCVFAGTTRYVDLYHFSGTAGQQVAVTMSSSSFDTYLYLLDSSGQVLTENDDGGGGTNSRIPAFSGHFTLPATGSYTLYATSYSATGTTGSTGSYSIGLIGAPSCSYTLNPTSRSFGASGGSDSFIVTAPAGCSWAAASNVSWITTASSGAGSGTVNFSVAANSGAARTGSITVGGQTFAVTQSAGGEGGCPSTALVVGQAVGGALTTSDCVFAGTTRYVDLYHFSGTAGQQVAVTMSSSSFDTYLYLLTSSSQLIAQDDDGGGGTNSRIPAFSGHFTLPATGSYTLYATSYSATGTTGSTGSYSITVTRVGGRRKTAGVFRPTNGIVYLKNANSGGFADLDLVYGVAGDQPVAGDWNGDGVDTLGIYRNGTFYLRNSNTTGAADLVFPFGAAGDLPVAGDWDGDGIDTVGVYRPTIGVFFLRNSNSAGGADVAFVLGNPGDVPIAGDWNGDGVTTTGVFRPSNGIIYLKNANVTGNADIGLVYGNAGDMPLAGDWDGDGVDSVGIYRAGLFYLRNSNTQGFADLVFALGNPGDVPIAGDWDGLP